MVTKNKTPKFNDILIKGLYWNGFCTGSEIPEIDENFFDWFQKKLDKLPLDDHSKIPGFDYYKLRELKSSKEEGIIIGKLKTLTNAQWKKVDDYLYNINFIDSEEELIKRIVKNDYWSNWYTENNGIEFKNLDTLLQYRNKAREEFPEKFKPIELVELNWDDWRVRPSIANEKNFRKKQIKNKVLILTFERWGNTIHELCVDGLHGIVVR